MIKKRLILYVCLLLCFFDAYTSGFVKIRNIDFLLGDDAEISFTKDFASRYDDQTIGSIQTPLAYRKGYNGEGRLLVYFLVYKKISDETPIEEYRITLYGNDYLEFNFAGKYHNVRRNNIKIAPVSSNDELTNSWLEGVMSRGMSLINGYSPVKTE